MTLYRFPKPDPIDSRLTWRGLLLSAIRALFGWGALLVGMACVARIMGVL